MCPTHGLRYDPAAASGCIRCRASSAPPARPRAPVARSLIFALLAVTLVGLAWFGWNVLASATRPAAPRFTHEEILAEARHVHVVIYSATWCPSCDAAKLFLWQNDIPFEEHDIDKEKGAADRSDELNPKKTIPVIDIEGTVVVGAAPKPIIEALLSAAERHLSAETPASE